MSGQLAQRAPCTIAPFEEIDLGAILLYIYILIFIYIIIYINIIIRLLFSASEIEKWCYGARCTCCTFVVAQK